MQKHWQLQASDQTLVIGNSYSSKTRFFFIDHFQNNYILVFLLFSHMI